ncbi:M28 family peptidase [Sphingomicrobium sediminis]|uniref:Carboxypeptidase Q n=1 Tax=Sphingomicrobium sediminis TaxID=2950949 RepID=A0A9X2EK47_9SPHN|nr:M28 family peptidase [Sphingomicrobium sediminis]MCM8556829.1 M28 family peptidase [Sphingomicrobium sediminis]
MTKTSTRLALAALVSLPAVAIAQPAAMPTVDPMVAELRDAALEDELAWELLEGLTTEVGPRLAGTEAEARARDWAVEHLTELGFANVRVEEFTMPTWVRGEEKAEIIAPFPQELVLTALGNSGSTGPDGLEAEVIGYADYPSFLADDPANQAGKIVFISHAMPRNQDGSGYSPAFGSPRWFGPNEAASRGAAAIIVKSIGTEHDRTPHTGNTNFQPGVTPIPAAALAIPDANQLMRVLERADGPVTMKLLLTPRNIGEQVSGNVIAEVPGRNPDAKKLQVACHLDSWDNSVGAFDDGAGCAIVAAAAKRIMEAGRPMRTIEIVWYGAEEVGIWGGRDFAARHDGTDYHAVAESDFGADRVWKVTTNFGEGRRAEADGLRAALVPLGIVPGEYDQAGGADIGPLMREGAPGLSLRQDGTRYFDLHHTPNDTLDQVDPEQLRQNVAAWTAMLAYLSGGIE